MFIASQVFYFTTLIAKHQSLICFFWEIFADNFFDILVG